MTRPVLLPVLFQSLYVETTQCSLKLNCRLFGKVLCHSVCTLCVCTFVHGYLCKIRFKSLGQHTATVWDYDSGCLLITQAAALLLFAYGYFAPFDYTASNNCQKNTLTCTQLLSRPASPIHTHIPGYMHHYLL